MEENTATDLPKRNTANFSQPSSSQWSPYQYYAALERLSRKVLLRRRSHKETFEADWSETDSVTSFSSASSYPKSIQIERQRRRRTTAPLLYDLEKRAIALILLAFAFVYGYWAQTNQLPRFHDEWQLFKEALNDLAKEADRILQIGLIKRPPLAPVPDDNRQQILFRDADSTTGSDHFAMHATSRNKLLLASSITEATTAAEAEAQLQSIVLDLRRIRRIIGQELEPELMVHLESLRRGPINNWLVGDPVSSQLLQAGYAALDQLFPFQFDPQLKQDLLRAVDRLTRAHEASRKLSQALTDLRRATFNQPHKALESLSIQCQTLESKIQLAARAMEEELTQFYDSLLALPVPSTSKRQHQQPPASPLPARTDTYQTLRKLFQKHNSLYSVMLRHMPA